jgi:flagellin
VKINGTETASFTITSNGVSDAIQKINAISSTTGVQASATDDYKVLLTDKDGDDIVVNNTSDRADLKVQAVGIDGKTPYGYSNSNLSGTNIITLADGNPAASNDTANIRGNLRLSSTKDFLVNQADSTEYFTSGVNAAPYLDVSSVDVSTRIGSTDSLAIIDGAIAKVSAMRGSLGTLQNRLDYCVSNLLKVTEFTIGARSRIQDADFAAETSRLAKAQVLQQAGAAMLSQANASTDTVLQLLRA